MSYTHTTHTHTHFQDLHWKGNIELELYIYIYIYSRAVKMAEKLNSNFVPKYYQNSNYIRI